MGYGHLAVAELQTRDLSTPAPMFQEVNQIDNQNVRVTLRMPDTLGAYDVQELILLTAFSSAATNPFANKTAADAIVVAGSLGRPPIAQSIGNSDVGKTFIFAVPIATEDMGKKLYLASALRDSNA